VNRFLASRAYWVAVGLLLLLIAAGVAFALVRVLPEVRQGGYEPRATATPGDGASPQPGSTGIPMNGAIIPAGAQCAGCHLTDQGVIGLRQIPALGHPLQGWGNCTACHAAERLAETAPGHTGIHATECLTCHVQQNQAVALSRPHRDRQNTNCLSCHGSVAPLPSDMTHRSESVCWLCHRLPEEQPPIPAHQTVPGETDCLTCHVAGKVGALPADHADRTPNECLLCHDTPLGNPAVSRLPILSWPGG
jgi:hypothetical protein